jgi:hypothetical protein
MFGKQRYRAARKGGGKLFFAVGYPEVAPRVRLTVQRSMNAVTVSHPVQCVFKTAVLIPNPAKLFAS